MAAREYADLKVEGLVPLDPVNDAVEEVGAGLGIPR